MTTKSRSAAAAANDSDRKWPLVWKGPFVFLERFILTTTMKSRAADDDDDSDRKLPLVWEGPFVFLVKFVLTTTMTLRRKKIKFGLECYP